MKLKILLPIMLLVLVSGVYILSKSRKAQAPEVSNIYENTMEDIEMEKENANNDISNVNEQMSMSVENGYALYNSDNLEKAQKKGRVVIFFYATWCPTCVPADKDILSNLSKIPSDLTILRADYDTEKKLEDKYYVTYQHTFVQIDKDGNEIQQWNGGGIDTILDNVK